MCRAYDSFMRRIVMKRIDLETVSKKQSYSEGSIIIVKRISKRVLIEKGPLVLKYAKEKIKPIPLDTKLNSAIVLCMVYG